MENILLKGEAYVKIADFGTGTDLERAETCKEIGTACNNPFWDPYLGDSRAYDPSKWDVFQCGAVLLQMLCVDGMQRNRVFGPAGAKLWKERLFVGRKKTFNEQ